MALSRKDIRKFLEDENLSLDNHTRDSQIALVDERKELSEPFSNGLMYPADPAGDPAEVYNCRCTMLSYIPDVSEDNRRETYNEWLYKKEQENTGNEFTSDKTDSIIKTSTGVTSELKSESDDNSYTSLIHKDIDIEGMVDRLSSSEKEEMGEFLKDFPNAKPEHYLATKEMREKRLNRGFIVPAEKDKPYILQSDDRDPNHIFRRMLKRNITDDELRKGYSEAKTMIYQQGGVRRLYFGNGICVVVHQNKDGSFVYKTAWKYEDYGEKMDELQEALKKYGL